MKEITIEPATPDVIGEIAAIEEDSFSDPWTPAAFREAMKHTGVFFVCARRDGGPIVGYVVAWFVADEGEIANLAVSRAARRSGVGAALLDAAIREADARETATLYLEVRESNEPARALYASRGFEEIGRRREYYRRPVEEVRWC